MLWQHIDMTPGRQFCRTIFLLVIFSIGMQCQCRAEDKSKYFGAKLVELDALMVAGNGSSRHANSIRLQVSNGIRSIGLIYIRKFKTSSTAVEIATQLSQEYQLLSKPTSGWFSNDDSSFEGVSNTPSSHFYVRVMKSDGECYNIWGSMSEEYWKTNGSSLRSVIDSFKFN